jgi:hypothetical protein
MEHLSMCSIGYPWLQGIPPISMDISKQESYGTYHVVLVGVNTSHQKKEKRAFPKSSSSKRGHKERMVW